MATALRAAAHSIGPAVFRDDVNARLVADNSFDVIIRLDRDWQRVYISPAIQEVLGYTPGEFRGLPWQEGVYPEDVPLLAAVIAQLNAGAASATVAYRRYRRQGGIIWIESTFRRLQDGGGFVLVLRDVTVRKQADEQVRHLAHHDPLTGLPNRPAFTAGMEHRLREQARTGDSFALLALDLDRFKEVNDTLGHGVGDLLLKAVVARLQSALRDTDILARLGGDEFAVLIHPPVTPSAAAAMAGRIVEAVRQPYQLEGTTVVVGISVGLAMAPQDGVSCMLLMKNADLALYRAKSAGRNTFRFFEPEMDLQMQTRRILEMDMHRAVELDEFEVYYQPLFDVTAQSVRGFEALIRWNHPTRGLIPPNDFIPLAEETGLITEMGAFVLRTATRQAAQWGGGVCIAVNLSAVQINRGDLLDTVCDALHQSRLPAHLLELEITESVLLGDDRETLQALHALRGIGVRIAMDDFGTGYSSLRYLRSFPFDKIKIDRSFVQDVLTNQESAAIVAAVVGIGRRLGIATTAEGVETTEQMARMQQEGCDTVQGYLVGKPMPAQDAGRLLPAVTAEAA